MYVILYTLVVYVRIRLSFTFAALNGTLATSKALKV